MEMRSAIATYLDAGWHLIPLKPGRKVPLEGHGVDHATNDIGYMLNFLDRYPDMNLGLALRESGLFAFDVDERSGGLETLTRLERDLKCMPPTLVSSTAQNGLHFIFQRPDQEIKNAKGKLPGIDIKASGGYIVLPPSRLIQNEDHRAGAYTWAVSDTGIASPPQWLVEVLKPKETTYKDLRKRQGPFRSRIPVDGGTGSPEARLDGLLRRLANGAEGERNNILNWAAHTAQEVIKSGEIPESVVRGQLYRAAIHAGLSSDETEATINSGLKGLTS